MMPFFDTMYSAYVKPNLWYFARIWLFFNDTSIGGEEPLDVYVYDILEAIVDTD